MAIMFAEFLDHRGRVVRRESIDGYPITIGRGRTNDIIVDDPKVCANHAELADSEERGLVLRDLNSINGTRRVGFDARVGQMAFASGLKIRIGDTVIRFLTPDHPVAPTFVDRIAGLDRFAPLRGTAPALWTTFALLIVLGVIEAMAATWDSAASEALTSLLGFLVLGTMWAGFWTLVTRLVSRRYRFAEHLLWAMLIGTSIRLATIISDYGRFMFPGGGWVEVLLGLFTFAAMGAVFFGHFSLVGSRRPGQRTLITIVLVSAFTGLGYLAADLGEADLFSGLAFDYPIRPVPTSLISTSTPDAFFAQVNELRVEVDNLIK